jgi:hypothetical protein
VFFLRHALTSSLGRACLRRCAPASLTQLNDNTTTSRACNTAGRTQQNRQAVVWCNRQKQSLHAEEGRFVKGVCTSLTQLNDNRTP